MAPKLYLSKISPPARSVQITAKIIGFKPEEVYFNLLDGDHHKSSDLSEVNPVKITVPSLDDDGFFLWDSHAIMIYLIEKYAKGNSLYPEDTKTRALIHQRLFFDCGDLFATHLSVAFPMFRGEKITEEKKKIVDKNFAVVENFLQSGKFIAGDQVTIADISIWCSLSNIFAYSPLDEAKYPNIKAWLGRMEGIPHANINIEGREFFAEFVSKLNIN